jgi:N4-gp56 family major capsid protein
MPGQAGINTEITTANGGIQNTLRTYFNKKLLENAKPLLRLANFATKASLPTKAGAKSITFFRPEEATVDPAKTAIVALAEGTPPTPRRRITYTPVEVTLQQIGAVAEITDIADAVGLFDYLSNAISIMGQEFAMNVEERLRNAIARKYGTATQADIDNSGLIRRYAGGANGTQALTAASTLKPVDLLDAMTALRITRAPLEGGYYIALMAPQIIRDLLNDPDWQDVVKPQNAGKIFAGEIGVMSNCKVVDSGSLPYREAPGATAGGANDTYTFSDTGTAYGTFVLGKGCYGAADIAGMKQNSNPLSKAPQIILNNKPDKSDPLGQYTLAGWKAYWGQSVLYPKWGRVVMSTTAFAG